MCIALTDAHGEGHQKMTKGNEVTLSYKVVCKKNQGNILYWVDLFNKSEFLVQNIPC